MRLFLCLILIAGVCSCSEKNKLANQLTARHWFVQADKWESERTAVFTTDNKKRYEWEAEFYPSGKMLYASFFPLSFHDTNGIFHLRGERFVDTLYSYAIKNDILKVMKADEVYYLKFLEKADNEFLITPALEKDFE